MTLDKKDSIGDNVGMGKRRANKLSDQLAAQLRRAIDQSGLTRYRIAKETGIGEATLSKFYRGQRGLSATALDRLGEFLNLTITINKPKPRRRGSA